MGLFLLGVPVLLIMCNAVQGGGVVKIRFVKYSNVDGTGDNGNCCDGKWGVCFSDCDHMFTICLDSVSSSNQTSTCMYGRIQTEAVENLNVIEFGSRIRDTPNPLTFNFSEQVPREMVLKVNVVDKDKHLSGPNDQVDFLYQRLSSPEVYMTPTHEAPYKLNSRTSLEVTVTVLCDPNYYSATCTEYCEPPSSDQHYTCDPRTGEKVCNEGWMGDSCEIEEETCEPFHCSNGGTCSVVQGKAVCACVGNFTGEYCENHYCEDWCQPGWCIYWSSGYACHCPDGHETLYLPGGGMACSNTTTTTSTTTTTTTPSTTTTTITSTTTPPPVSPTFPDELRENADCQSLAENGYRYLDGIYTIHPHGGSEVDVHCDMTHDGNGWTVIQRRKDGSENFNRNWDDYVTGFGTPAYSGEFWIGLENLHHLTHQARYKLQIQMQLYDGTWRYANYNSFNVMDARMNYKVLVSGFTGTAGDALDNGSDFSTRDRDNDKVVSENCAERLQSGWWFGDCSKSNLNGVYKPYINGWPPCDSQGKCVWWGTMPDYQNYSLKQVIMKVWPRSRS